MSFANEFKRAAKEIGDEIAYYRGFAGLAGVAEPLAALEELREDWEQRRLRFEGRGRAPSEPDDWDEDQTARVAAKERLDKIIKAAATAEEARRTAEAKRAAGPSAMYPCPCCGYEVFSEPTGSHDICPICFWEDDLMQLAFPDMAGGANKCSLIEGQQNFAAFAACEMRIKPHVRAPQEPDLRNRAWRPLDPLRDRYLKWERKEDHQLWQTVKDSRTRCLYYWLPDYSLAGH